MKSVYYGKANQNDAIEEIIRTCCAVEATGLLGCICRHACDPVKYVRGSIQLQPDLSTFWISGHDCLNEVYRRTFYGQQ